MIHDDASAADAPGATTEDAFLGGALRLLQPRSGYRAGLDAVLLAASVPDPCRSEMNAIDLGAGVGTAGLCLAARLSNIRVTLLEREPFLHELAVRNIARNDLQNRVLALKGDVADAGRATGHVRILPDSFDYILANPPFWQTGRGTPSPNPLKSNAHTMEPGMLDTWARTSARLASRNGRVTFIHHASALAELIGVLEDRFGALHILPIHARAAQAAIRVLVSGTKGSREPAKLLPGLVLQTEDGRFTPQVEAILRHGEPLRLDAASC
jgi:tRNA1(Val) A37 N6-methylase TrmN6